MRRNLNMNNSPKAFSSVFNDIADTFRFMKKIGVREKYFFLSVVLSSIAVVLQIVEIRFLIVLVRGILGHDFSFLKQNFIFGQVLGVIYDDTTGFSTYLIGIVLTVILVILLENVFLYTSSVSINYQVKLATGNIRKLIFQKYINSGKLFFDENNLGVLNTSLVHHSMESAKQLRTIHQLFSRVLTVSAYMVLLFLISWPLALGVVIAFPILNITVLKGISKIKTMAKKNAQSRRKLDEKIFNILTCIPLVKAYNKEDEETRRFNRINEEEVDCFFQMSQKVQLIMPLQNIITMVTILIFGLVIALYVPFERVADMSGYIIFFLILRRMIPGISAIGEFSLVFARASASLTRISDLLSQEKPDYAVPSGREKLLEFRESIEFRNLTFSYRELRRPSKQMSASAKERNAVLKDISFTIEKGKVTAIVGPTGSGKSTLIHLLMRYYDCSPGTIFIDQRDIREFDIKSLRNKIAVVSQDIYLFNDSIKENIIYGREENKLLDGEFNEVLKQVKLYDFIQSLPKGAETTVGDRGVQLSGGERQKIGLARAILKNAEILLLDEAMSAMDYRTERDIQETLGEVLEGRTSIIIAHRFSTIKRADKIVLIEDGRVAEVGPLERFMTETSKLNKYWQAQQSI